MTEDGKAYIHWMRFRRQEQSLVCDYRFDFKQMELRTFLDLTITKEGNKMTWFCVVMGALPFIAAIVVSLV